MKKIITALLCAVMAISMCTTAYAYESWGGGNYEYSGSGSSTLNLHVYSSCVVSIPETINIDENIYQAIEISSANLESGYKVDISAVNLKDGQSIQLAHGTYGSSCTVDCTLQNLEKNIIVTSENPLIASIYDRDMENGQGRGYFSVNRPQNLKAGNYMGTMQYSVSINQYTTEDLKYHEAHRVQP